jgi:hypothetical protein
MAMEIQFAKLRVGAKGIDRENAQFGLLVEDQYDGCSGIGARKPSKVLTRLRTFHVIVVNKYNLFAAADFEVVINDNGIGRPRAAAQNELARTEPKRFLDLKEILSSGRLLPPPEDVFAGRENVSKLSPFRIGGLRSSD